ncbi:hypothetical protein Pcinc_002610 [Petrolisthes cinctipes]|uniref:Uncharacterized protein n=1 Tax=Petrolisthes cinctipes TaxID=88211 RepID=A0AAE1L599_PETCI|nr:hypothetical protein Pcinc_002610 [Petrolisthes cinctipes]
MSLQCLTEGAGVEVWRRCGNCEVGEAGVEKRPNLAFQDTRHPSEFVSERLGVGERDVKREKDGGDGGLGGGCFRHSVLGVAGDVWLAVVVITTVWGVTLWLFQKVWPLALGGKMFSLNFAQFYSWGAMLDDPPTRPPNNLTGQVK